MNDKISKLRKELEAENLDGYIITSNDEFDSEYPPFFLRRLEYIIELPCSNGILVIFKKSVLFFTDARYLLAAKDKLVDCEVFNISLLKNFNWAKYTSSESKIGYDPHILTPSLFKLFDGLNLMKSTCNLVDKIWENRPPRPASNAYCYDEKFSGLSASDKIKQVKEIIAQKKCEALLITSSESVCWLLNIRASDNEFSPIMLSYCYLDDENIILFTNKRKFMEDALDKNVIIKEFEDLGEFLQKQKKKIAVAHNSNLFVREVIKRENLIETEDPILYLRSVKNEAEILGARNAHIEDAIAVIEFLAWFYGAEENFTEYEIGAKISEFRVQRNGYLMDSFAPICGFNANGSKIHYRAEKDSAATIFGDGLLLIDSGGHYLGGTTDITRTINVGKNISNTYKEYYTKVLKGHIALARIKFPEKITGSHLDILARQYLWEEGEDYGHGTGHGVGNALCVHEGPARISLHDKNNLLVQGMILSNEPGFYKDNEFGIRIENLQYIKKSEYDGFLEFEQLTMVPYCKELIIFENITEKDRLYLREYYAKIQKVLEGKLSKKAEKYLISQLTI